METQKIKIEKLVSGGHGLGYLDGRVILTPFSAPGDELLIDIERARKGVTWGNIKQILSPSPSRIEPFCPHYTECGGCQLQHISYAAQLECKRLMLDDALRRLAGLKDADVCPCIASSLNTGYRSRVRLHCDKGRVGFHKSRSNTIVPVAHCPVLTDNINACLEQLSAYISEHPIKGLSEIQISEDTDARIILALEMDSLPDTRLIDELKDKITVSGAVAKVGHEKHLLWGDDHSTFSVEGKSFRVGMGSFFQANISLVPILIKEMLDTVSSHDVSMGVELYAGVGVFCITLSGRIRSLVAVEWNRDAVDDAKANLNANQIKNVEVLALSAEDALDVLISRDLEPELVVLDPPREGLSKAVRDKLIQLSPQQLVYVSCDPATLARDIKSILASGAYHLEKVQPLDMFPHTSHIETVCSIEKD